jgi:hypothetical protein
MNTAFTYDLYNIDATLPFKPYKWLVTERMQSLVETEKKKQRVEWQLQKEGHWWIENIHPLTHEEAIIESMYDEWKSEQFLFFRREKKKWFVIFPVKVFNTTISKSITDQLDFQLVFQQDIFR